MRNQLLRDADWAGMAHSVEIRVPLVDAVLLAKLADMGLGAGQRNLKHLLLDACNEPEAPSTIPRRKTGFLVPIAKWIDDSNNLSSPRGSAFPCCDRRDATGRDVGRILWRAGLEACGF